MCVAPTKPLPLGLGKTYTPPLTKLIMDFTRIIAALEAEIAGEGDDTLVIKTGTRVIATTRQGNSQATVEASNGQVVSCWRKDGGGVVNEDYDLLIALDLAAAKAESQTFTWEGEYWETEGGEIVLGQRRTASAADRRRKALAARA